MGALERGQDSGSLVRQAEAVEVTMVQLVEGPVMKVLSGCDGNRKYASRSNDEGKSWLWCLGVIIVVCLEKAEVESSGGCQSQRLGGCRKLTIIM